MLSLSSCFKRPSLSSAIYFRFSSSNPLLNHEDYAYYSKIRIYKDKNFFQLWNQYIIAHLCKNEFFVKNSLTFVNILQKALGQTISTFLVRNTMGSIFTGGESLHKMNEIAAYIKKEKKIPVVYFYSHEVMPGYEFTFDEMEVNKKEFFRSMEASKRMDERNMVALKVSAIGSFASLKVLNTSENNLVDFFLNVDQDKDEKITMKQLKEFVFAKFKNIKEEDFSFFVNKILEKNAENDEICLQEWKMKVHAIYISDQQKTQNAIIKSFSVLSEKDYKNLNELNVRFFEIFEYALKLNARVLVDAEQTFAQKAVETLAEQFQVIFNKKQAIIYNTVQNYLKSSQERIRSEIFRCKKLNLPLALKMVRGAYMDEERLLAQQAKVESPICETFQQTSESYHNNIKNLISNLTPNSELLIGSHNKDSVLFVKSLLDTYKINKMDGGIKFGQLLGLADHLTFSLNYEGYHVLKLIPYGETKILIPYLLRRAQESKVNLSSTVLQKALLMHEIRQRILRK